MGKNLSSNTVKLKRRNDILLKKDSLREKNYKELTLTLKKEREINDDYKARIKNLEDELDVLKESSHILDKDKKEVEAWEKQAFERAKAAEARTASLEQELTVLKVNPSVEVQKLVLEQYQASEDFQNDHASAAFPEWQTGWDNCQKFLTEGGVQILVRLTVQDFWAK